MEKIRITKVKSAIDRPRKVKATLEALGLRKVNSSAEHVVTPQIEGMVKRVAHLVSVEKI